MILGFKNRFEMPIMQGTKTHTIREDKHKRWKAGMVIHFATGVRTPKYKQFHLGKCTQTKTIKIEPFVPLLFGRTAVFVEGKLLNPDQLLQLAFDDGFDSVEEFFKWFDGDFEGTIIYWT